MKRGLVGLLLVAGIAAHAEYSSYFYWQVDASVVDFSYAQLRLSGGSRYFTVGDTAYTKVGAETSGGTSLGRSTQAVAANLGAYASGEYSFLVEVFGEDGGLLASSDVFSYDDIAGAFVYSDIGSTLSGTAYGVNVSNVPEPTGGVLLLLGLAALGLRRRSEKMPASRRSVLAAVLSLLLPLGLLAEANDVVLTFATAGPDRYADGTPVLDGESYALVWTRAGATFGGIASDGALLSAEDRFVLVAGVAEGGRCPTTVFEIDAADSAAYEGGSFALYLLDTRVKDTDGNVSVAGADALALTAPEAVNAMGLAAATAGESESSPTPRTFVCAAPVDLGAVGASSKLDAPTITAIKVADATISITVKGASPIAEYYVVPGETPRSFAPALETRPEGGTFTFPKPKDATFFKVIGIRNFP